MYFLATGRRRTYGNREWMPVELGRYLTVPAPGSPTDRPFAPRELIIATTPTAHPAAELLGALFEVEPDGEPSAVTGKPFLRSVSSLLPVAELPNDLTRAPRWGEANARVLRATGLTDAELAGVELVAPDPEAIAAVRRAFVASGIYEYPSIRPGAAMDEYSNGTRSELWHRAMSIADAAGLAIMARDLVGIAGLEQRHLDRLLAGLAAIERR